MYYGIVQLVDMVKMGLDYMYIVSLNNDSNTKYEKNIE